MWYPDIDCSIGFEHWSSANGILGLSLNLIIIVALILLMYKLFRPCRQTPPENRDARDSLVILKQRLTKGEINEDEYQRIRSILGQ